MDAVDAVDFVFVGALRYFDCVVALGVEGIELAYLLRDVEDAVFVEFAQPVALVVAQDDVAEHGAGFAVGAAELEGDGQSVLAVAGGVDGSGEDEVVEVLCVFTGKDELGGFVKTHPLVVWEGAFFVEKDFLLTGAEEDEGE